MTVLATPLPDDVQAVVEDPARLEALAALDVLDDEPDADFERLSRALAHMFKAEFALVSLVGKDRQWFRACFGIDGMTGNDVDLSFCAHTLAVPGDGALVVLDASTDERFASNPQVTGWPNIRFYAGVPIIIGGQRLGTLCVLSATAREQVDPDLL